MVVVFILFKNKQINTPKNHRQYFGEVLFQLVPLIQSFPNSANHSLTFAECNGYCFLVLKLQVLALLG